MSMVNGDTVWKSIKQKLNTNSSTEYELVAIHDVLSDILWSKNFLEDQVLDGNNNIVYQDNKSALLLELNGIKSKGNRSKHIKHHYFFIKDKVDNDNVNLEWFISEKMMEDGFTKTIQGSRFLEFRKFIMNE